MQKTAPRRRGRVAAEGPAPARLPLRASPSRSCARTRRGPDFKVRVLQIDPRTVLAPSTARGEEGCAPARRWLVIDAGEARADAVAVALGGGVLHRAGAAGGGRGAPGLGRGSGQGGRGRAGRERRGRDAVLPRGRDPVAAALARRRQNPRSAPQEARVLHAPVARATAAHRAGRRLRPRGRRHPRARRLRGRAARARRGGRGQAHLRGHAGGALRQWYPLQQKRIRYFKKPQEPAAGDENN